MDTFKYCKYLKGNYNVSYIGFDYGHKKIEDDVNVFYVKRHSNKAYGMINFCKEIINEINSNQYDITFLVYFPFCFLMSMFSAINFLDIRTGNISEYKYKVKVFNFLIFLESNFFKKITIISDSLRKQLAINKSKTFILPLGVDFKLYNDKKYSELKLLYIGTLSSRNIHHTIEGLSQYIINSVDRKVTYDIFGDGSPMAILLLKNYIKKFSLEGIVTYHGRKRHDEIGSYFKKCNIGVSYIPITDYFNNQPPTKTFEYLGSGMITLATNTFENKKLVNHSNGVLHNDNASSFFEALSYVKNNLNFYSYNDIIDSVKDNNWRDIVENKLIPIIENKDRHA